MKSQANSISSKVHNKRSIALDLRRREQLAARGFGGSDEKTAAQVPALYADDVNSDDISPAVSTNNHSAAPGNTAFATTASSGPMLGIPREMKSEKEMLQEKNSSGQDGIGKRGWSLVPGVLRWKMGSRDAGTGQGM